MVPTTKMVRKNKKSRAKLNGGAYFSPLTAQEAEDLQSMGDLARGGGAYVNEIPESVLDHLGLTLTRVTENPNDMTVILTYINEKGEEVDVAVPRQTGNSLSSLNSPNVIIDGWGKQLRLKLRKDKGRRLL